MPVRIQVGGRYLLRNGLAAFIVDCRAMRNSMTRPPFHAWIGEIFDGDRWVCAQWELDGRHSRQGESDLDILGPDPDFEEVGP